MSAFCPLLKLGILALISMLSCQNAFSEVVSETGGTRLAELIVGPEKGGAKITAGARNQREKAGAYQKEAPVNSEEEYGLMSPRSGSPSEERAYENRNRARSYQQAGENTVSPVPAGVVASDAAQGRSSDPRARAQAYVGTGNGQDIDLSNVGRDGIPLVPCRNVDNVSGRIGDDSVAGSLVFIIRHGQQVKVRCR